MKTLIAGSFATLVLVGCVDQPNLGSTAGMSFEEFKAKTYREPETGLYVLDWDTAGFRRRCALQDLGSDAARRARRLHDQRQDIKWTRRSARTSRTA